MAKSILIIGAGVIGSALAFQLSRQGAQVTVLEAATPASAATGRSFGWINASYYVNSAHHALRVEAIAAHHRLAALLPTTAQQWHGTLWFEEQGAGLTRKAAELADLGYPVEILDRARIATLEPQLAQPTQQALHFPSEGSTDAATLTHRLLAASGARILQGVAAKSLIENGGQITGARTAIGPFTADHTFVAAGIAAPALLAPVGIDLPMLQRPGLMVYTKPVGWRINHILVTADQEIRQDADGALLAPGAANHQSDASETIPDPAGVAQTTLLRLRVLFGAPDLELDRFAIAHRPVPADGLPVIGAVLPGLCVAVMHSGVTLAPLVAEGLAAQVIGQGANPMFADFSPRRLIRAR